MIATLRIALYRHGYLLFIAAWLYTISFVITNYWAYDSSPRKVKYKLENKIQTTEAAINKLIDDKAILETLLTDSTSEDKLNFVHQPYGLFLYTKNDLGSPILNYWNSNLYTLTTADVLQKDGNYFIARQNGEHEVVKRTVTVKGRTILLMAVVPIRWDYFIENKYLHKYFDGFQELSDLYEISNDTDAVPILNSVGNVLFKIKIKEGHTYAQYDASTIYLRVLFLIVLVVFINRLADTVLEKHGLPKAMFFLVATVSIIRLITYHFSFPFDFSRLALFDPSIYASNFLHPSLGHLLVNSILLFWLTDFWKSGSINCKTSFWFSKYKWLRYSNILLLLLVSFATVNIASSLVNDSKISFDVTHFFSLDIYSITGFVILAFLVLSFYHISHILLRPLVATNTSLLSQLLVAAVGGLAFISFRIGAATGLNMMVLGWVIGYLAILHFRKQDIGLTIQKSSMFIFWVSFFAFSITMLISWQNQGIDILQRKKMAEQVLLQNDANGENVLSIAVSTINAKGLALNYPRLETEYANKKIKDSILNENFTGYLNRFETSIYTFNPFYQPLFNEDTTFTYPTLTAIINLRAKATSIPNLYTWQNENNQVTYIYSIPIGLASNPLGYFFLVAKSKKYKSEALYPVLFSQANGDENWSQQNQYSEAIYVNGRLESKFNDYDFPLRIKTGRLLPYGFEEHSLGSSKELWYNAGTGKTVIIAKASSRIIEAVTLFAYLFFTFLVVIGLLFVTNFLLNNKLSLSFLRSSLRLNMQAQIHVTVIFISIFSFVVIGTATISFFTNRFKTTSKQRLSVSIEMIADEIGTKLHQIESEKQLDDSISDYGPIPDNSFERNISDVSETHNVDINFYTLAGNLLASTQPHIYSKQLLNTRINPIAYFHLQNDQRSQYVQTENIGNLDYLSMYMPILDDAGKVYAYINIPYLNSEVELNQEISSFIATIINLNAFIFLIAGLIAYTLTQRVVASFSIIANKMKEVNIGKKNEAILWEKDDEIGELVNEYNKMVQKLEQSADALARSEREGAWREMARQVAHEIKNPLTPMKLSIQYLQRAIDNDMPNAKELTQKVAATLIDQIDQLAKIAGDFSQFANIDNADIEPVDISEKLNGIVQLYQQSDSIMINYEKQPPTFVMGDKTQLSRLFTNLIKNAIESVDKDTVCRIDILQYLTETDVTIIVKDNGKGIPQDVAQHIFQPNFTTKTSGTGLGLAISRGIVERIKGAIDFETKQGVGTTFIIKLPLIG